MVQKLKTYSQKRLDKPYVALPFVILSSTFIGNENWMKTRCKPIEQGHAKFVSWITWISSVAILYVHTFVRGHWLLNQSYFLSVFLKNEWLTELEKTAHGACIHFCSEITHISLQSWIYLVFFINAYKFHMHQKNSLFSENERAQRYLENKDDTDNCTILILLKGSIITFLSLFCFLNRLQLFGMDMPFWLLQ